MTDAAAPSAPVDYQTEPGRYRHWKLHFVFESEPNQGPRHLETPWLFNIKRDPKEETDAAMDDGWVRGPMRRMVMAFAQSLRTHPPIPPGAPDDFDPARSAAGAG